MKMTSEENGRVNVVKFSNGVLSPQIHFGTYRIKTAEDVRTAVSTALEVGYRAFDTASVYKNHRKIAETFKEFLPKHGLSRKDIFLTSKLAPKDHGEQKCEDAIKNILTDLDTDYLDLFLIHWPGVQKLDVRDPENRVLRAQSWRVLERHHKLGTFRAIGVSNYTAGHLAELLAECGTAPHVLQTELHPHYPQPGLTRLCDLHNIHVQAYSSLGAAGAESPLFQCPEVTRVADSLGRSRAQVLLRWATQRGRTVMPKSVTPERIRENFHLDFEIPDHLMAVLDGLSSRVCQKYAWNPENVL